MFLRRLKKNKFIVGMAWGVIFFWMTLAILSTINTTEHALSQPASHLFSFNYQKLDAENAYLSPQFFSSTANAPHYLGTDNVGRDVAAGICHGAQITLYIAVGGYLLTFLIGFTIGAFAGFFADAPLKISFWVFFLILVFGFSFFWTLHIYLLLRWMSGPMAFYFLGVAVSVAIGFFVLNRFLLNQKNKWLRPSFAISIDFFLMRGVEVFQSVPIIFWLLAAAAFIPKLTPLHLIFLIGVTSWMGLTRLVRAEFYRLRTAPFVDAARALGVSTPRLIVKHILPNLLGTLWVASSYGIASVISFEALISYLGIGLPVEEITWGTQLSGARQNFAAWWLAVFPGFAIFSIIFSLNTLGREIKV